MDWSTIIFLVVLLTVDVVTCTIVYHRANKAYGYDFVVALQVGVTFFLFPLVLIYLITKWAYVSFIELEEKNRKSAVDREVRIKLRKILNETCDKALRRSRIKQMEEANEKKT